MDRDITMRYLIVLLFLTICATGCSAGMVNLDPKFQDIDNSIAQNEARLTALEAEIVLFNQTLLDLIPPGFVLCVISSTTAFNWEVKYGTDGVKVTEIIP